MLFFLSSSRSLSVSAHPRGSLLMADVASLVRSAQELSSTPAGLAQLQTLLDANAELIASNLPEALAALDTRALLPDAHALAWIHILHATLSSERPPRDHPAGPSAAAFSNLARVLLLACDATAARADPRKFARVCGELREIAVAREGAACVAALAPLRRAVDVARPDPDHLTPQHHMVFQCALVARCLTAVVDILERPVYEVDPERTGVTADDHLLYRYYGGVALAALGNYREAAEMFLGAIAAPATALSAIVVAAHKKYACVSLIADGAVPPLPRYVPAATQRGLKRCAGRAYPAMIDAFVRRDAAALAAAAEEHAETFERDDNKGLVARVVDALAKRKVRDLTRTYLTLSLADIAASAGLEGGAEEAERAVAEMIESGDILATVSQRDGTVRFHDADDEQYAGAAMAERLDAVIADAMALNERVRARDDAIKSSRTFLEKAEAAAGAGAGPGAGKED